MKTMHANLSHLHDALPSGLSAGFALTVLAVLILFVILVRRSSPVVFPWILGGLVAWLALLGGLAAAHFFERLDAVPPRLLLAVGLPLVLTAFTFGSRSGQRFLNRLPLTGLTWLHVVRVPVELVLYGLFTHQQIPLLMTFEGRNVDILSGLTAPLAAYWVAKPGQLPQRLARGWNVLALLLLINIVVNAFLAAPLPFQQQAFEQPNVGVLRFPFIWLPGFVVPLVLFSHLVALKRLWTPRL